MQEMKLQDLKSKKPTDLIAFAESLEVENASVMRKQELMFAILKKLAAQDVEIIGERAQKLETHFNQARADLEGIGVASERAGKRAARLDNFDFEELAPDDTGDVVSLPKAGQNQ